MLQKNFDPNIAEEIKGVKLSTTILAIVCWILILIERFYSKSIISFVFLFETVFIFFLYFSYLRSITKRNYIFWAISFLITAFLLKCFVIYSFSNYHQSAFILVLIGSAFLGINCYIVSSPLYYARVQWWEYDYKYRSDLRVKVKVLGETHEARLTDFRRSEASIELFDFFPPETKGLLVIFLDGEEFAIDIKFKTSQELIRGRPISYGVVLDKKSENFNIIKSFWQKNKKAKIRNRFLNET